MQEYQLNRNFLLHNEQKSSISEDDVNSNYASKIDLMKKEMNTIKNQMKQYQKPPQYNNDNRYDRNSIYNVSNKSQEENHQKFKNYDRIWQQTPKRQDAKHIEQKIIDVIIGDQQNFNENKNSKENENQNKYSNEFKNINEYKNSSEKKNSNEKKNINENQNSNEYKNQLSNQKNSIQKQNKNFIQKNDNSKLSLQDFEPLNIFPQKNYNEIDLLREQLKVKDNQILKLQNVINEQQQELNYLKNSNPQELESLKKQKQYLLKTLEKIVQLTNNKKDNQLKKYDSIIKNKIAQIIEFKQLQLQIQKESSLSEISSKNSFTKQIDELYVQTPKMEFNMSNNDIISYSDTQYQNDKQNLNINLQSYSDYKQ